MHQRGYASYNVVDRRWQVTPLGKWMMNENVTHTTSGLPLRRVTDTFFKTVGKNPQNLIDLLCETLEYSIGKAKLSEQEESIMKLMQSRLASFVRVYPAAIEAIWGDGVERLVGGFSGLMAAILLHLSSLAQDYRTQSTASVTIPKIADQYFKQLSVEFGGFLADNLADPAKLAALDRKVRTHRGPHHV